MSEVNREGVEGSVINDGEDRHLFTLNDEVKCPTGFSSSFYIMSYDLKGINTTVNQPMAAYLKIS